MIVACVGLRRRFSNGGVRVLVSLVEEPDPQAPLGAKGVGEPPCIAATVAVVAAIRDATGEALTRVPVRPQDIALASRFAE